MFNELVQSCSDRMMPMNFSNDVPTSSIIKDRVKSGASLADVEPMTIDKSVSFSKSLTDPNLAYLTAINMGEHLWYFDVRCNF